MMFVISAPQHTAPNTHTPVFLVFEKHISTSASRKKIRPFSPSSVMSFMSGVRTTPRYSPRKCITVSIALS